MKVQKKTGFHEKQEAACEISLRQLDKKFVKYKGKDYFYTDGLRTEFNGVEVQVQFPRT